MNRRQDTLGMIGASWRTYFKKTELQKVATIVKVGWQVPRPRCDRLFLHDGVRDVLCAGKPPTSLSPPTTFRFVLASGI